MENMGLGKNSIHDQHWKNWHANAQLRSNLHATPRRIRFAELKISAFLYDGPMTVKVAPNSLYYSESGTKHYITMHGPQMARHNGFWEVACTSCTYEDKTIRVCTSCPTLSALKERPYRLGLILPVFFRAYSVHGARHNQYIPRYLFFKNHSCESGGGGWGNTSSYVVHWLCILFTQTPYSIHLIARTQS